MNDLKGDLISRQAAIDAVKEFQHGAAEWRDEQEADSDIWHRADSAIASAIEIGLRIKAIPSAQPDSCEGCKHMGLWENEIEYGYPNPCTRCKRRASDNYER